MALHNDAGRIVIPCREAAKLYGCRMGYMRRLARDGKVKAEESNGVWMFDLEDVRELAKRKDTGRHAKRSQGFVQE